MVTKLWWWEIWKSCVLSTYIQYSISTTMCNNINHEDRKIWRQKIYLCCTMVRTPPQDRSGLCWTVDTWSGEMIWCEHNYHPGADLTLTRVSVWPRSRSVSSAVESLSEEVDCSEPCPGNCHSASRESSRHWPELDRSKISCQCTVMLWCPAPESVCLISTSPWSLNVTHPILLS